MWSKEEIGILINNIDRYVKVVQLRLLSSGNSRLVLTQPCISGSGHRRPGRDHLRDVQRGEEGLLPLGGFRPEQAAVRRLQTGSADVRQQEPRWQVSEGGRR